MENANRPIHVHKINAINDLRAIDVRKKNVAAIDAADS
jgi:hypothetical protein